MLQFGHLVASLLISVLQKYVHIVKPKSIKMLQDAQIVHPNYNNTAIFCDFNAVGVAAFSDSENENIALRIRFTDRRGRRPLQYDNLFISFCSPHPTMLWMFLSSLLFHHFPNIHRMSFSYL